jgi:outer membrane protein insertion porin family
MRKSLLIFSCFLFLQFLVPVAGAQDVISAIDIVGNQKISDATVISKIKTKVGQQYNDNLINQDIENLYQTGFFENISVEKETEADKLKVVFKLQEKPVIEKIEVEGTQKVHRKHVERLIDVKEGSFLDEYEIKQISGEIRSLYYKRGYAQTVVDYQIQETEDNKVIVTFNIKEEPRVSIKKVIIKGNENYSSKKIKSLMRTKARGWFFRKGILKPETLEDDIRRIEDFYKKHGFNDVVVDYAVDYLKQDTYVTITIQEGQQFFVGQIDIKGNQHIKNKTLKKKIVLKTSKVYTQDKLQQSVNQIKGAYVDKGYIYATVQPSVDFNSETEKVDITFDINERDIGYVNKIKINGNVKTKDEIIRRELRIYPGDKFQGDKIRTSKRRLDNLGFFEEVRFDSEPSDRPNWENLIVDVKEAKTGYLSFGGGYSTVDQATGFIELRQRNFDYKNWRTFTGAGQDLSLKASFGSLTEVYELSFTNPWIYGRPISFGFDLYKRGHQQDEDVGYAYEENIKGGAFRFGREFNDQFKGWIGYRFETVEISDVVDDAATALQNEEGENDLSTIEMSLSYDTRDNRFSPREGLYFTNSLDTTGIFLGGDKDFIKLYSSLSKYYPMPKEAVLEGRLRGGLAEPVSNTDSVPIYKRFFAGGARSIRGYEERSVGPIDSSSEDPIGGEAMFIANLEYTYPLADVFKVATFFDSGNVWAKNSDFLNGDFKSSVGLGFRINTPLGPLSLDYGWPLDTQPGKDGKEGRFHFSISKDF